LFYAVNETDEVGGQRSTEIHALVWSKG